MIDPNKGGKPYVVKHNLGRDEAEMVRKKMHWDFDLKWCIHRPGYGRWAKRVTSKKCRRVGKGIVERDLLDG